MKEYDWTGLAESITASEKTSNTRKIGDLIQVLSHYLIKEPAVEISATCKAPPRLPPRPDKTPDRSHRGAEKETRSCSPHGAVGVRCGCSRSTFA